MLFDYRPKVHPPLIDAYYTPGTPLAGRCLYPFLQARVSFSGKVFFCPFIRVEVGDLTTSTLERGVEQPALRRHAQAAARQPSCSRSAAAAARWSWSSPETDGRRGPIRAADRDATERRACEPRTVSPDCCMRTLLINPPLVNGIAFTRQGRCQEREEVLGTTKPPYSLLVCAALFRERGAAVPLHRSDGGAALDRRGDRAARRRRVPARADRLPEHDADARRRRRGDGAAQGALRRARSSASARTPRRCRTSRWRARRRSTR